MPTYLRFVCPNCRSQVRAAPHYAGLPGDCPECGGTITVPRDTPEPTRPVTAEGTARPHDQVPTLSLGTPALPGSHG